jgi:hypothetical protein
VTDIPPTYVMTDARASMSPTVSPSPADVGNRHIGVTSGTPNFAKPPRFALYYW